MNNKPLHLNIYFFALKGAVYYVAIATVIFSHVKTSCFRIKAHLVFHWCLFNKRFSYHFIKMWNSDELPEQIYQPLGTQNDCATVLDNYPHVMIKIHHGGELFLVINKALIFGIGLKFRYI